MTIYNVLAPPAASGPDGPDPDGFVFVKDGFCWPAFYMTAIWLLWRRMWLVFVLYCAAVIGLVALASRMPPAVAWWFLILFGVLIALEANNLRRWTLERRGYRFLGVISGDHAGEAEFRFFAAWATSRPKPKPQDAKPSVARTPIATGEVVGLFPEPGGAR